MSTRARTRAATAASTSKTVPMSPEKSQPKLKSHTRKVVTTPASSHQLEEKENFKTKGVKMPTKTPSKVATSGISIFALHALQQLVAELLVMTWEGDDALETLADAESAFPAKTPAKKIRRDSPVESPASESEGGASSEDEYVAEEVTTAKGKGVGKIRRLSYSSESDSGVSDDAKPRRHRTKKATASPPPNILKRKHTRATQTPPPKRKKSDAVVPTDDPVRKYCLTKLEELFRDVFLRYPHVRVQTQTKRTELVHKPLDELTEDEKNALLDESRRFADELERCVFDVSSEQDKSGLHSAGASYKDRFRTLQFNLSQIDRVVIHRRIVSGEITPKEISLMTSTDLANEETKQSIKIAEKEALAYSILKPTTAPRAKITHKGLEDIEDVHGGTTTVQDEERLRREEEEKREEERLARLKAQSQPRQRTASISGLPESPVDVAAPSQQPWGGPPPVPLHALLPDVVVPSSPLVFSNEASPSTPIFSQPFLDVSEPELNLADFINIDEEVPAATTAPISSSPPSSTKISVDEIPSSSQAPFEHSPIAPTGISPFAQKPESSRSMSFDLNALWSAPKPDTPTSPSVEEPVASTSSPQVTAEDKDSMMDIEGGGADDYDFDMFLDEKDTAAHAPEAQQAILDALPHVWTGKINMPLDSTIPQEISVNACQVGGRPLESESLLWKTLFPSQLLRIDGRVPVENSGKFLLQMRMNSAKELLAVAFSPSPEADDVGFRILSDFLIAKGRHGLIFPWGPKPKENHPGRELYIIPLLSSDPLPEYLELLDNLHLPKVRTANLLIGVWILNKGKLAPPPAPPEPAIPSLSSRQQQTQPSSNPTARTPPAPPLPANIAAEVASLTPEQIQLMIQTLTANGTMPLPVLPLHNQPPVPQPPRHSDAPPQPPPPPPSMLHHQQPPHVYPPHPPQPWVNNTRGYGGMYQPPPPPPLNPPTHRPAPLSWDRPGDTNPGSIYDRDDRGGRSWRGHGSGTGSRGRGRGNDVPPKAVDSGWPRKPRGPGQSSPAQRWG
ncbi:hypothetical protein H0H87_003887 [Tephrocybe sp. NHM501043]|nr:hypothetical protein H0H87_003887 [Tephrocybe sp. NHM501043]